MKNNPLTIAKYKREKRIFKSIHTHQASCPKCKNYGTYQEIIEINLNTKNKSKPKAHVIHFKNGVYQGNCYLGLV